MRKSWNRQHYCHKPPHCPMVRARSIKQPFVRKRTIASLALLVVPAFLTIAYVQLDLLLPYRHRVNFLQDKNIPPLLGKTSLSKGEICTANQDTNIFQEGSFQPIWKKIEDITAEEEYQNSKISGGIFLYPRQTLLLYELIQQNLKKRTSNRPYRVCETGFGSGHSTALFLSISPQVEVITFDKFDRPYQRPVLEMLNMEFPNRIQHIQGNSCKTVPSLLQANGFSGCDLLHGSSLCKTDNIDLVQNSEQGTILTSTAMNSLSDRDVYFGSDAQWRKLRAGGCIRDILCFGEGETVLERSFVFASENELILHKFCFAQVTGKCTNLELNSPPLEGQKGTPQVSIAMTNDFLRNMCPQIKVEPFIGI